MYKRKEKTKKIFLIQYNMNTILLYINNDILNIIGAYVKPDNLDKLNQVKTTLECVFGYALNVVN